MPARRLADILGPLRPLRVMMLITPVTASEPQTTLDGPRTISIRSTLSVVSVAKSKVPPDWFIGTPSMRILV